MLDMSALGDVADVNPVIKFLPHTCNVCGRNLITGLTSATSPRVDISSTCKVGQKVGVSLPLLTCSPSAWPSRLLYCRGRKFRKDVWLALHFKINYCETNYWLIVHVWECTQFPVLPNSVQVALVFATAMYPVSSADSVPSVCTLSRKLTMRSKIHTRDFRLPPRSGWELRSSGLLRSE